MLLSSFGPQVIGMTGLPLDQLLVWLQSILRWEFLPLTVVVILIGPWSVANLLEKSRPWPRDLAGPPPFDEALNRRLWEGHPNIEDLVARDRANWPSQWRSDTQQGREKWQESENRRVQEAHRMGLVFLASLLLVITQTLWSYLFS